MLVLLSAASCGAVMLFPSLRRYKAPSAHKDELPQPVVGGAREPGAADERLDVRARAAERAHEVPPDGRVVDLGLAEQQAARAGRGLVEAVAGRARELARAEVAAAHEGRELRRVGVAARY